MKVDPKEKLESLKLLERLLLKYCDKERLLRHQLPNMEMTVSSQYSPDLADILIRGKLAVAFLREEHNTPDLNHISVAMSVSW